MHVPSIVNSLTQGFTGAGLPATVGGFTLIAEDGNFLPNVAPPGATTVPAAPRVQTDVFMAAGKVYDVLINAPSARLVCGTAAHDALLLRAHEARTATFAGMRPALRTVIQMSVRSFMAG